MIITGEGPGTIASRKSALEFFYDLQHFENHVACLGSSVDLNWHNGKGESTALPLFS